MTKHTLRGAEQKTERNVEPIQRAAPGLKRLLPAAGLIASICGCTADPFCATDLGVCFEGQATKTVEKGSGLIIGEVRINYDGKGTNLNKSYATLSVSAIQHCEDGDYKEETILSGDFDSGSTKKVTDIEGRTYTIRATKVTDESAKLEVSVTCNESDGGAAGADGS